MVTKYPCFLGVKQNCFLRAIETRSWKLRQSNSHCETRSMFLLTMKTQCICAFDLFPPLAYLSHQTIDNCDIFATIRLGCSHFNFARRTGLLVWHAHRDSTAVTAIHVLSCFVLSDECRQRCSARCPFWICLGRRSSGSRLCRRYRRSSHRRVSRTVG